MANMSSISCATTCGQRLPVSARKGSRAAPSATRDGASYPQYAFQAAAISDFTSRITQQLIGRATERAAAIGADVRFGRQGGHKRPREAESFTDRNTSGNVALLGAEPLGYHAGAARVPFRLVPDG